MAGCCPGAPAVSTSAAAFSEASGPESDIRPGESVDCYMARGGNTTGQHDDATENVLESIENTSIPISQGPVRFDNIQFKLTDGSVSTPVWSWTNNGGEALATLGVSLTTGGVLNGTINSAAYGKTFNVLVSAGGTIAPRSYVFAPAAASKSNEIRLVSPLPGAIVNSKFGPRFHPIHKVMKPHNGIDMKYKDRSVKDVVAAADGEVTLAGGNRSSGYGVRVHIKHTTSTGSALCTTTYNHLERVYVKVGQKVMAGQAIGLEGTTGSSTGNHLHFECKLPDGKFIDPEPLINGSLTVAGATAPNGDAVESSLTTKNSSASLSESEVKARSAGCPAFGPDYPPEPGATDDTPPAAPITDPFERAWFFTMTEEVGPFWDENYPLDPDVIAGLIDTAPRRKKVGYVNTKNFPGGETKFGVAQKPNPSIRVVDIGYEAAKKLGFNVYWKGAAVSCVGKPAKLAVFLFDMNYLHGPGNARSIWNNAVSDGMNVNAVTAQEQDQALAILKFQRDVFINRIPRPEYTKGWKNRSNAGYKYSLATPI